jgi:hypothetical protein
VIGRSERIKNMANSLSDHATAVEKELESEGLVHVITGRLAAKVKDQGDSYRRLMS